MTRVRTHTWVVKVMSLKVFKDVLQFRGGEVRMDICAYFLWLNIFNVMFAYFVTGCLGLMQTQLSMANCLDFDQVLQKQGKEVQKALLFAWYWDAISDRWKQVETPETLFLLLYDAF